MRWLEKQKKIEIATIATNCYNFLKQGARWDRIRQEIIQVRWLEKQKKIEIVPVWETRILKEIEEADRWSKASASTDEWGLQEDERENLWRELAVTPTVDALHPAATRCVRLSSQNGRKWEQQELIFLHRS